MRVQSPLDHAAAGLSFSERRFHDLQQSSDPVSFFGRFYGEL